MLDHYKAVIFDWDGTLVDTCGLILDAHNHVREFYDLPLWTMADFMGRASESAREYYPKVYGDKADEAQTVLYDYVEEHHLKYLAPMEGALDLVKAIKTQAGLPVGIVSNKLHKTLLIEIEHLGWAAHFDNVVGAGIAEKDKPNPHSLIMGIEGLKADLTSQDILYVGDTETDLLCSRNTGCDVIFLQTEGARPDLIEKYAPKHHFMTTNEFYCYLFDENSQKDVKSA